MKNITVTVHDETYREARVWAAKENTTVSALVRRFLESLGEPTYSGLDLPDNDWNNEQAPNEATPSPQFLWNCETVRE
jgi:hypothetical protein